MREMKNFKLFIEAKQVGTLYHLTSIVNAINIIEINKLIVGKTGYLSFTRNKNLAYQSNIGFKNQIMFKINGNKLSNNYQIKPYKYHSLDVSVNDESEERIIKKDISNFIKYVDSVYIFKNTISFNRKEEILLQRLLKLPLEEEPNLTHILDFLTKQKIEWNIK